MTCDFFFVLHLISSGEQHICGCDDLFHFAFPISATFGLPTSGLHHTPITVFATRALAK